MNPTPEQIKEFVRNAGGIVHSDGNIFFTNAAQFIAAGHAAALAELRDGGVELPEPQLYEGIYQDGSSYSFTEPTGAPHVVRYWDEYDMMEYRDRIVATLTTEAGDKDLSAAYLRHEITWSEYQSAREKQIDYGDRRAAAMVPQWLPIASAPKDGTAILGHWADGTYDCSIYAVKYLNDKWWQANEDYRVSQPTHWMPLPAAPKEPT